MRLKTSTEPLRLDSGCVLPSFELAYELYGQLSRERDNAILLCHSLTKDCHAAGATELGVKGWWNAAIGPGRMLDTNRYCVVSVGALGSNGCSGPRSIDAQTNSAYGTRFPIFTVRDLVRSQKWLADELGISRFVTVIGGCLGGQQALQWAITFPEAVQTAVVISTTAATSAHSVAIFDVMSRLIRNDPAWNGGDYYGGPFPIVGLRNALIAAVPLWMSKDALEQRFGRRLHSGSEYRYRLDAEFEVEAFLDGVAERAGRSLDPNGLLYLMRAAAYFDLPHAYGTLREALRRVRASVLLISYESDWRYPPDEVEELQEGFRQCGVGSQHVRLRSTFGHGAFLHDLSGCGPVISDFIRTAARTLTHA